MNDNKKEVEVFGISLPRELMTPEICKEILQIKGEHNLNGKQISNQQATIELMKRGIRK